MYMKLLIPDIMNPRDSNPLSPKKECTPKEPIPQPSGIFIK
jgi:hypothetical protein